FFVDQILYWSVIVIIVIFQPEIRRGLEHLGRSPIFGGTTMTEKQAAERMIGELDKAIQYMSKRRIGALITIQQNTGLEDYIERSEEHTSELQSRFDLVCRLLLEKKK